MEAAMSVTESSQLWQSLSLTSFQRDKLELSFQGSTRTKAVSSLAFKAQLELEISSNIIEINWANLNITKRDSAQLVCSPTYNILLNLRRVLSGKAQPKVYQSLPKSVQAQPQAWGILSQVSPSFHSVNSSWSQVSQKKINTFIYINEYKITSSEVCMSHQFFERNHFREKGTKFGRKTKKTSQCINLDLVKGEAFQLKWELQVLVQSIAVCCSRWINCWIHATISP